MTMSLKGLIFARILWFIGLSVLTGCSQVEKKRLLPWFMIKETSWGPLDSYRNVKHLVPQRPLFSQ